MFIFCSLKCDISAKLLFSDRPIHQHVQQTVLPRTLSHFELFLRPDHEVNDTPFLLVGHRALRRCKLDQSVNTQNLTILQKVEQESIRIKYTDLCVGIALYLRLACCVLSALNTEGCSCLRLFIH